MLEIGLLMRNSGVLASVRLGIVDKVDALDFDLAVSRQLITYDFDTAKMQAKLIAYEVSKMFGDGSDDNNGNDNDYGASTAERW